MYLYAPTSVFTCAGGMKVVAGTLDLVSFMSEFSEVEGISHCLPYGKCFQRAEK